MFRTPSIAVPARVLAVIVATAALAACAGDSATPKAQPTFYDSLAQPGGALDAKAAASMISGYRANNGLDALSIDPQLMQMAETQAHAMADRDKIDRNLGGAFNARLKQSGYDAKVAAENISH